MTKPHKLTKSQRRKASDALSSVHESLFKLSEAVKEIGEPEYQELFATLELEAIKGVRALRLAMDIKHYL